MISKIPLTEIRSRVQRRLSEHGVGFIEEIIEDELEVLESGDATLKRVVINNLQKHNFKKIWRINLEKRVQGLATSNKTTEIALLTLSDTTLVAYFIEMKSVIQDEVKRGRKRFILSDIHSKFEDSISRFCYLLLINTHPLIEYEGIDVKFKGIVFYDRVGDIEKGANSHQMYKIFRKQKGEGQIKCETFLDDFKIRVKFIKNEFLNEMEDTIITPFERVK